MHIIDAHVHIFQPRIAEAAVRATNAFYDGSHNAEIPEPVPLGHLPGTAEDLLPRMEKDGVDRAVVFSTATAPMSSTTVAMMVHNCPRPSCSSWWCSWWCS